MVAYRGRRRCAIVVLTRAEAGTVRFVVDERRRAALLRNGDRPGATEGAIRFDGVALSPVYSGTEGGPHMARRVLVLVLFGLVAVADAGTLRPSKASQVVTLKATGACATLGESLNTRVLSDGTTTPFTIPGEWS